jgi:putative SOS response-associated peptidase YedK
MEAAFNVTRSHWAPEWASWNVAPTTQVPVVRRADGACEGAMLRWGLIPSWAHGQPGRYATINARVETVAKAASYRSAWRHGQRCVIPALAFYEWQQRDGRKQPWCFARAGGEPFGLAGLWERSTRDDGEVIESCTIITLPANPLVGSIHARQRMPAILEPADCAAWFDASVNDAIGLLAPYPAELMDAWPVSRRVNSPRNDEASLMAPLDGDDRPDD